MRRAGGLQRMTLKTGARPLPPDTDGQSIVQSNVRPDCGAGRNGQP